MSVTSRKPLRQAGAQLNSGGPNTGEFKNIRGGDFVAVIWSGAVAPSLAACPTGSVASGGHVLLQSGAGRLNSILPHVQMASGLAVYFYDAGAITASGTSVSGQKIIGVLPATWPGGTYSGTGLLTGSPWNGEPLHPDFAFNSGLCAAVPSGAPGFSCNWMTDNSPAIDG